MNAVTGPWDDALIDLFRSEVETHSELLGTGLLALERTPADLSRIDEMMRAAHSIKGASRVVGVEPAVRVAHVMEDCFVAAQQSAITLGPADVDVLLRGVDLLGKISAATRDPRANLADDFREPVQAMVDELQAVLHRPRSAGAPSVAGVASGTTAAPAATDSADDAGRGPRTHGMTEANGVTISAPANLDAAAAEEVRRELLSAIDAGCRQVRLDLHATRDLDVQGLALLAAIPRHLAERGGISLQLGGVSPEMASVLRVTGLVEAYQARRSGAEGVE